MSLPQLKFLKISRCVHFLSYQKPQLFSKQSSKNSLQLKINFPQSRSLSYFSGFNNNVIIIKLNNSTVKSNFRIFDRNDNKYEHFKNFKNPLFSHSTFGTIYFHSSNEKYQENTTNSRSSSSSFEPKIDSNTQPKTEQQLVNQRRKIAWWLLACAGMCLIMVIVGGLTRLTESGLSITEWKPFRGAFPPLSKEEWEEEFEKYKKSPEYLKLNFGISLSAFKEIYLMEWFHRELGRITGLVFSLPLIYFLAKGWIPKTDIPKYLGLLGLGSLQGLIGWIMVKSGLDHANFQEGGSVPRVSQYRLAAHFSTAVALYSSLFWMSLNRFFPQKFGPFFPISSGFRKFTRFTAGMVFLTAFEGAFVAGLDAGFIYNEFPKMGSQWIPEDILRLRPLWKNFFEHDVTVQFVHRVLGVTTYSCITFLTLLSRYSKSTRLPPTSRNAFSILFGVGSLQVALGITTLLTFVPIPLAATHQAGALALMTSSLWVLHTLKRIPKLK